MILDAHTHIFPSAVVDRRDDHFDGEPAFRLLYATPGARLVTAERLIEAMDVDGVDHSVVCGFPWRDATRLARHNDVILEAAARHSPRLIPFACVDPFADGALDEAARCLDAGARGLGELALYADCDRKRALRRLEELAHCCAARKAVMMVHANEPVGHAYPGKSPLGIDFYYELAKLTRNIPLILAHWGGGLFFYELLRKETADILAHVFYDSAASPFLYRRGVYRQAVDIAGPGKILFGSDYPLIRQGRCLAEVAEEDLPRGAVEAICGGNAARLFGIV